MKNKVHYKTEFWDYILDSYFKDKYPGILNIQNPEEGLQGKFFHNDRFVCKTCEINQHINSIERARDELKNDMRTRELKNWLDYLNK